MINRVLVSAIAWLLAANTALAAVALDACGTGDAKSNVSPLTTTVETVGSISNGVLIALVYIDLYNAVSSVAVNWDQTGTPQAMTSLGSQHTTDPTHGAVQIFYLLNPTAGNKTAQLSWTGSSQLGIVLCSYSGATTPTNFTSNTGTSTAPSTGAITSANGNQVIAGHASASGNFSSVDNTAIVMAGGNGWDNAFTTISGAANQAAGAATVTLGAMVGSSAWVSAGINIPASGAAPSSVCLRNLLGVGC